VISREFAHSRFERTGELRLPSFEQTADIFAVFLGPRGVLSGQGVLFTGLPGGSVGLYGCHVMPSSVLHAGLAGLTPTQSHPRIGEPASQGSGD
jgi:hypothetical protein